MRTFIGLMGAVSALLLVGCVGSVDESASAKDEAAGNGVADGPVAEDGEAVVAGFCNFQNTWNSAWATNEQAALDEINKNRLNGAYCQGKFMKPGTTLTMGPNIRCAARYHSQDMAIHNFVDHPGTNGDTPMSRLNAAGVMWSGEAEACAGGYTVAKTMVQKLMSDGHCQAIMSSAYSRVGIGYDYKNYGFWTVDFVSP